jgi:hypothetical protein
MMHGTMSLKLCVHHYSACGHRAFRQPTELGVYTEGSEAWLQTCTRLRSDAEAENASLFSGLSVHNRRNTACLCAVEY